jgi:hypothetical protein
LPEANVASSVLSAAGMTNSLSDTAVIGLFWQYSNALGGIRLRVRDSDLEEADDLLRNGLPEVPEKAEPAPDLCPSCREDELFLDYGSRKTLSLMFLFSVISLFPVPLWVWRTRERCRSCGFSRPVPLTFRPEIAIAILLAAVVPVGALTVFVLAFGFLTTLRAP